MRKKLFLVIITACLLLTLAGTNVGRARISAAPVVPYNEITLNQKDEGQTVQLDKNDLLTLNLISNPSTGYRWEVQTMNKEVLQLVDDVNVTLQAKNQNVANRLGAPVTQRLRFAGISRGESEVKLVYRRPWEDQIAKTYSVQVQSETEFEHMLFVQEEISKAAPVSANIPAPEVSDNQLSAVPSSFNWCDNGGCTSVKNQGSCGSCWAFSTVGILESAIKVEDSLTRDLSEQYLVSCNSDGWDCEGGWWAHDYHKSKIPYGEPAAGAVYETEFPYTATDSSCNPPHSHFEKIVNWEYVGNDSSTPAINAMKQDMYDHGPLSVAVCAGNDMQNYTGGIFQINESSACYPYAANHAVILVGWNEAEDYWIMRNSWGPSWGENGYMRIKYGTSNIGYTANYVEYEASGPTPTPSPTPVPGQVLLVDDDKGQSYQNYYSNALTALGHSYDTWSVSSAGSPSASDLSSYSIVIWLTGNDYSTSLTSSDISALSSYLNGGGSLFISGQDIGYDIRTNTFYGNYLHASYVRDDTNSYTLNGADFLSGKNITINGTGGANNQNYPSEVSAVNGGFGIFDYSSSSYGFGGVAADTGVYKVVYFSFGFEAINTTADRNAVMDTIINWLD